MSTGNIIGKLVLPKLSAASGVWGLSEQYRAAKDVTWPGSIASDSYSSSNFLTLKTVQAASANNTVFYDRSGNNFSITRNGDVAQGTLSPYTPTGYWSAYFDKTGDYLELADNAALNVASGDFTIEFWWFPKSGSYMTPFDKGFTNAGGIIFQTNNTATNTIDVYISGSKVITANAAVTIGGWNHIALVRSGTTMTLYQNGAVAGSVTNSTNLTNSYTALIGCDRSFSDNSRFVGYMSNLRIVKGTAVYTAAFSPPQTPLTAISGTTLLTLQDNQIKDRSSNNFTITKYGDTAISRFSPLAPPRITPTAVSGSGYSYPYGGSAYFDGSGDYLSTPTQTSLNFSTGDFTVEAWVNFQTQAGAIVSTYGGWWLQYRSDYSGFCFGVGDTFTLVRTWTWTANKWVHVAVTRSGTSLRMFIDGVQQGATATDSTNFSIGSTLYVGALFSGFNHLTGSISNLRVIKGSAAYTSNFTPPTTPVTAISGTSLLLDFDNAGIYDSTGINNIAPVGTVSTGAVSKYGAASTYFSGSTSNYLKLLSNIDLRNKAPFTWECWFRPDRVSGTGNYEGITTTSVNSSTYPYFWLCQRNATLIWEVATAAMSGWQVTNTPYGTLAATTWTHLAVCGDGTNLRLFQDGVQVATTTHPLWANTAPLLIGALPGQSGCYGYVEDVRLSMVARYTGAFTPPAAPLA